MLIFKIQLPSTSTILLIELITREYGVGFFPLHFTGTSNTVAVTHTLHITHRIAVPNREKTVWDLEEDWAAGTASARTVVPSPGASPNRLGVAKRIAPALVPCATRDARARSSRWCRVSGPQSGAVLHASSSRACPGPNLRTRWWS